MLEICTNCLEETGRSWRRCTEQKICELNLGEGRTKVVGPQVIQPHGREENSTIAIVNPGALD